MGGIMNGARGLAIAARQAEAEANQASSLGAESSALVYQIAKLRQALYESSFAVVVELEQLRGEIKRR
jgi:hypothetical protein